MAYANAQKIGLLIVISRPLSSNKTRIVAAGQSWRFQIIPLHHGGPDVPWENIIHEAYEYKYVER
jgi:hypothetical protein